MTPAKKFSIRRKDWLRGGKRNSYLRNGSGKMCCLGFYLRACGVPSSKMVLRPSPASLMERHRDVDVPRWLATLEVGNLASDTSVCNELMSVNDDTRLKGPVREAKVAKLFKKRGIAVTFTG